jgi:AraC family transcriptional regulator
MDLHATNFASRLPGHCVASPYGALSGTPGRLADEAHLNHHRSHQLDDRTEDGALQTAVEMTPSESVIRHGLSWHGLGVETAHITEHRKIESRFRAPVHMLVGFEEGARKDGFTFVEGLKQSALQNCGGKLIFVPSGHEYFDRREPCGLTRVAYFYIHPAALPANPDGGSAEISFAPRLFFEDPRLWDTAIKLKALIDNFRESDRLYRESLGVVLAHVLVRLNHGTARAEPPVRGGLAAWQQRAVAEYIEEHVAEQISLIALAQLARLSPYHFSRAFKRSFGIPPHRFHMRRRMEHAKSLLARPAASVTFVGMSLGFSETSSFTAAFRRTTGLTPTDYKRSVM